TTHAGRPTRLKIALEPSAPRPTTNILVPSLNPAEMFAGIVTAIDLGLAMMRAGENIRFIATDLPIASRVAANQFIRTRIEAGNRQDYGLLCTQAERRLPVHPQDRFVATAWWTAHAAADLIARGGFRSSRFIYL